MTSDAFTCDLDPDTETVLQLYLFTNVQNADVIRNNIVKGIWNCAVIKASLIMDPLQVVVAANKAVVAERQNTMVTKTVYAEILYNLSLTKNISQSLSKFGVGEDSNLLFCFLTTKEINNTESIISQIEGKQQPTCDLPKFYNRKDINSVYKLHNVRNAADVLDVIVSKIVTKNFISH